jgi:hypothetical protein
MELLVTGALGEALNAEAVAAGSVRSRFSFCTQTPRFGSQCQPALQLAQHPPS